MSPPVRRRKDIGGCGEGDCQGNGEWSEIEKHFCFLLSVLSVLLFEMGMLVWYLGALRVRNVLRI